MQKKVWVIFILGALLSSGSWAVNGDMGKNTDPLANGSQAHPWRIQDLADFNKFRGSGNYWDDYVHLECDLNLAGTTFTKAPISPAVEPGFEFQGIRYIGHFEGNDHSIRNLKIASSFDFVGLFGFVGTGGVVRNLIIEDAQTSGVYYVGTLCGWNEGEITNCQTSGAPIGHDSLRCYYIGGICGVNNTQGLISNCSSKAHPQGRAQVGGLCGANDGLIQASQASGVVACSGEPSGGLCGTNSGIVQRSYSSATVTSPFQWAGGLCGENRGTITDCYSSGAVTGGSAVGGLCGWNNWGTIRNCYSVSPMNGTSSVAGVCGHTHGSVMSGSGNFWDIYISGTADGVADRNPDPAGVSGKTTADMMTLSTFTSAGWDFSDTDGDPADWMMRREGEDYPRLAWQPIWAGDIAGLYGVDLVDFAELARNWMEACGGDCEQADIDADGQVGIGDLAAVAANWLRM